MKKWLIILLDLLRNLFRWRAQVTDPLAEYRKAHEAWAVKYKELQDAQDKVRAVYRNHCAAHGSPHSSSSQHTDTGQRLWSEWLEAARAIGNHRAREPRREDY